MTNVANVEIEPERCRAICLRLNERGGLQVAVGVFAGPDRRQRDHMGEVQRV